MSILGISAPQNAYDSYSLVGIHRQLEEGEIRSNGFLNQTRPLSVEVSRKIFFFFKKGDYAKNQTRVTTVKAVRSFLNIVIYLLDIINLTKMFFTLILKSASAENNAFQNTGTWILFKNSKENFV
jgi:hypothetical protein